MSNPNLHYNKSIYEIGNEMKDHDIFYSSCKSPVNIALIKYWGKINESLIIPVNDSLSLTLNTDDMFTHTTIAMSLKFKEDELIINGNFIDLKDLSNSKSYRINKLLNICRSSINWNILNMSEKKFGFHINSFNNFPTSAGLASSSSGFSAIAVCLSRLFRKPSVESSNKNISYLNEIYDIPTIIEISELSRLGSGSSCRSLFGGFVKWINIKDDNSKDIQSKAIPISKDSNQFLDNIVLMILVTNSSQKLVGSTEGMRRSIHSSELLQHRIKSIVPKHMEEMENLIHKLEKNFNEKDFSKFCKLTMVESNQLQAICRDSYPPIIYTNQTSDSLIDFVILYNDLYSKYKDDDSIVQVAYTFDAGPNAFIFMSRNHVKPFFELLRHSIDIKSFDLKKMETLEKSYLESGDHTDKWIDYIKLNLENFSFSQHLVIDKVFCTSPGKGPILLNSPDSCLYDNQGEPVLQSESF